MSRRNHLADILSALSCIRGSLYSWDWVGTAVESGCLSEGRGRLGWCSGFLN